ncbi:NADP-dependent oxidoreductase [Ancrocorticia populi]|uniref:Oxidoreductase n=1 Tax=Ancrocorticia populi TaxID=2175228 RepID=A0A2V1K357_9ACTO|nr:NADP-dependent oxidoreductase [Ancrocorticia populi]PWF25644.1 oxidoreductase [Ancrocorticia populi]
MNRAIEYQGFGTPSVLDIVEAQAVEPGEGEVRVSVEAAGLNPVDWKIFSGSFGGDESKLPKGVAKDFAGVIDAVGRGVAEFAVGDEVLGSIKKAVQTDQPNGALANHLVASVRDVAKKPEGLSFVDAASLGIPALTACGSLRALEFTADDVIVISAASGGVGSIVVQLAASVGATVIGIASESSAEYLRSLGAVPVAYGPDLASRVRAAAQRPVTKLLDCFGEEYIDLALELGLSSGTYGTLVGTEGAVQKGASLTGSRDAQLGDLGRVAKLVADGTLKVTVADVYPFTTDSVREAYAELQNGHVRGKLVVDIA